MSSNTNNNNNNNNSTPHLTPEQLRTMEEQLRQQLTPEQIAVLRQQMMQSQQQQQHLKRPDIKSLMQAPSHMVLRPILLPQLVDKLYDSVVSKMDEKFRFGSKEELSTRLREVLFMGNANVFWLTSKMIHGLMHWDDVEAKPLEVLCQPNVPNGQRVPGYPPLSWCCQWRTLQKQVGWAGKDDFVALLIAAGADVKNTAVAGQPQDSELTPMFHAANFGTVDTMRMLYEAGADFYRTERGRKNSVLKTIAARPDVDKVKLLLQHAPEVAKEKYMLTDTIGKRQFLVTPADLLLNAWFSDAPIMSWQLLGPPSPEDCHFVLLRLIEAGSQITSNAVAFHFLTGYVNSIASSQSLGSQKAGAAQLGKALIGTWLPPDTKDEVLQYKSFSEKSEECGICKKTSDEVVKPLVLSCSHMFCLSCIKSYGETNSQCPIGTCRRMLCRELHSTEQAFDAEDPSANYGGPENLSEEQLKRECEALKIDYDEDSRNALVKARVPSEKQGLFVETSLIAAVGKNGPKVVWMAPKQGPVFIPITMKGVPIFASMCTWSNYTLVSTDFVETYGLKKSRLVSRAMKSFMSSKLDRRTYTVIDEFEFYVGGVCVKMNNAVEISPSPSHLGIQLGQDFFQYAAYSKMTLLCNQNLPVSTHDGSTPVGKDFIAITEGGHRVGYTVELRVPEELRYYGWCGKSARVPIYHANHSGTAQPISALKTGSSDHLCHWCNREFAGMMRCTPCTKIGKQVNYCDEKCQKKAWKVHKTCPPHAK